ncbi:MAG: glycosyltransferase family 9 protein [Calditrichaeota bacterium]|nr:glycosyltransferase family 9 protein [Calditrichota bacterium]
MRFDLRRILLIRTDRIGDVILTTPVASILKQEYPEAKISFLARSYTATILRFHQDVDQILIYDPENAHKGWKGHLQLARELQNEHFDAAFLFFPTFPLAWCLFQSGIPRRVGMGFRWYSPLFLNWKVYEHRKYGVKHELEYNLSLLTKFVDRLPETIPFRFQVPESLIQWRHDFLKRLDLESPYIIIHPGNGGSAPNLNISQYQFIIRWLLEHTEFPIFITGSFEERILADQILAGVDTSRLYDLSGKLSLEELIAFIAGARLFISSSTGPLHIANAFQVPVLAFYCPAIPCSPRRWGPYHQLEWAIMPDIPPCKTCNPSRCPHGNCLEKLPELVIGDALHRRFQSLSAEEKAQ